MRIALLSEFFSSGMGYVENVLPKYLARLGAQVHVVATDLPLDFRRRSAKSAYTGFSNHLKAGTVHVRDGYTVHVLGHKQILGHMRMVGLRKKLESIRPEVVQTLSPIGWIALDAAIYKTGLHYKLFTGCHYHASVFPFARKKRHPLRLESLRCTLTRTVPGRLVSLLTERCYAITSDCADVAVRFFGVQEKKAEISVLGVDTEFFHPAMRTEELEARSHVRQRLGFSDSDVVCIYTGRFDAEKNPALLARAVRHFSRTGAPFRGLFVGNGEQGEEIASCGGCVVHPFVPFPELADFYRAADVGVWPTQESMSMLDAAACGIPIIANDTMSAPERIEGNGIAYRLNDLEDLIRALLKLQDPAIRRSMGAFGAQKIARSFSWESVAKRRLHGYEISISLPAKRPSRTETITREIL